MSKLTQFLTNCCSDIGEQSYLLSNCCPPPGLPHLHPPIAEIVRTCLIANPKQFMSERDASQEA